LGWRLDLMILEVFSNFYDSVILSKGAESNIPKKWRVEPGVTFVPGRVGQV